MKVCPHALTPHDPDDEDAADRAWQALVEAIWRALASRETAWNAVRSSLPRATGGDRAKNPKPYADTPYHKQGGPVDMLYVTRLGRATDNRHLHNNQAIRRAQLELQRIVSPSGGRQRAHGTAAQRGAVGSPTAPRDPGPTHSMVEVGPHRHAGRGALVPTLAGGVCCRRAVEIILPSSTFSKLQHGFL